MIVKPKPKVSKASVHYRTPKDQRKRCGTCAMLHGRSCDLVEGTISPSMVCDKWVKKNG